MGEVVQNGTVVAGAGGSYSASGDKYTGKVSFGMTERQQPMVGRSFTFTSKFEGGKWHHKGVLKIDGAQQEIDEIWERVP